jgi:hypothetical protein
MALSAHLALLALAPATAPIPAAAGVIGTAGGCAAGLLGASLRRATFGVLALFGSEKMRRLTRFLVLLHYPPAHAPRDNSRELAPVPFVRGILPEFMVVWAIVSLVGQVPLWRRIGRHAIFASII